MTANTMEVTARSYAYELSVVDFMAVEKLDDEQELWADTLCAKLEEVPGVSAVEYNGHFGAFIYFRIDAEDDCEELRDKIDRMIRDYVEVANDS